MRKIENPELLQILNRLRKNKTKFWKMVRTNLLKANRQRANVNINKLSKLAKDDFVLVVPGKVLGKGIIKNKFTVIAFDYSKSTIDKMNEMKCNHYKFADIFDDKEQIKVKGKFMIVR